MIDPATRIAAIIIPAGDILSLLIFLSSIFVRLFTSLVPDPDADTHALLGSPGAISRVIDGSSCLLCLLPLLISVRSYLLAILSSAYAANSLLIPNVHRQNLLYIPSLVHIKSLKDHNHTSCLQCHSCD